MDPGGRESATGLDQAYRRYRRHLGRARETEACPHCCLSCSQPSNITTPVFTQQGQDHIVCDFRDEVISARSGNGCDVDIMEEVESVVVEFGSMSQVKPQRAIPWCEWVKSHDTVVKADATL
ncbi:hypothetical protein ACFX1R_040063 [Malus domestica]